MATKAGKGGAVYLATYPSIALSNEATTNPGSDLTNYQITNAAHRMLDPAVIPVIQQSTNGGASWGAVTNPYSIQYPGGWVRFTFAQPANTTIRFQTGSYFVMAAAGNAREWQLSIGTDLVDVSVFGSVAKTFLPVLHAHTGSFKQFWADTTLFSNVFNQLAMFQLYVDSVAGTRFEGYGSIKSDAVTAMVNGVIEEDVPFQISGEVYLIP